MSSHERTPASVSSIHEAGVRDSNNGGRAGSPRLMWADPAARHRLPKPDIICFSDRRWDFVYQRPQHLLSRCARDRRVFFVEAPVFSDDEESLEVVSRGAGLY